MVENNQLYNMAYVQYNFQKNAEVLESLMHEISNYISSGKNSTSLKIKINL